MWSFSNEVWQNSNKALSKIKMAIKTQKPVIADKLL